MTMRSKFTRKTSIILTMTTAKDERKDALKTKKVQKVPGERRNPGHVHVVGLDSTLQHTLESDRQRERQLNYNVKS